MVITCENIGFIMSGQRPQVVNEQVQICRVWVDPDTKPSSPNRVQEIFKFSMSGPGTRTSGPGRVWVIILFQKWVLFENLVKKKINSFSKNQKFIDLKKNLNEIDFMLIC